MKITGLLLMLSVVSVFASKSYSQTKLLNLNLEQTTVKDVLSKIEDQSEFYFMYSGKVIDADRQVSVKADNQKIDAVLNDIFAGTDVDYTIRDRIIVLTTPEIFSSESLVAFQQPAVSGTVTDESGEPLPGVTVVVKGTTQGTVTNADGNYSLSNIPEDATLQFSFVGMRTQEVIVGNQTTINIALEVDAIGIEEVVAVGYQTQRVVDLTGAISVVDMDEVVDKPAANPMQSLQGRVPGLYIEQTGQPSGATGTLLIRGLNTLGNNSPLYIIDGVPTKNAAAFRNLDANSIESVQVLKDASAASIYGARASNGVIIVTTKRGQKGDVKVEISSSLTLQKRYRLIETCNTLQRGEALWQASINDGTNPNAHSALYGFDYSGTGWDAELNEVIPVEWIGGDPEFGTKAQVPGTDWQEAVYRNGLLTNNNITISTGSEKGQALLGLGYISNQGIMEYSDFKKVSLRINSSYNFWDNKITIGENLNLAYTNDFQEPRDLGGASMHYLSIGMQPILPIYTEDGGWSGPIGAGFSDRNNPLHMLYIHRNNRATDRLIFGNIYADINLTDNLLFRSNFGLEMNLSHDWWVEESYQTGFLGRSVNSLDETKGQRFNWTWSNTLNYQLDFAQHSFDILAGIEAIKNEYSYMTAYKEKFALNGDYDYMLYLGAGTGLQTNGGSGTGHQLMSFFGKVNYSFSDKYLASATVRYDGSSRFGQENQYGTFPAVTLGWRINNEDFFNIPEISNLKFRAGWGIVGNQEIGDVARFGLYVPGYGLTSGGRGYQARGTAYDLNGVNTGTLPSGYLRTQLGNPELRWESTEEINLGVDFGLFDQKVFGSFDYYTRTTEDILIQPPYPSALGTGGDKWVNGATIENKGYEIVIGVRDLSSTDFKYEIRGNIHSFHDEITYLPEDVVKAYPGNVEKTILGRSQRSLFGYITDGLFETQAEVDAHADQPGKGIGRIRFKDLNGDGKIDPLDQDWLGTTLPDFEYGLNADLSYKNIGLSMFISGVSGKNDWDGTIMFATTVANGMNFGPATLDAWTPNNTDSDIPMISLVNANDEGRPSDWRIRNVSYMKLRSLQLSYNFPQKLVNQFKMERLRIYLLGENLLLIQDKKGKDKFWGPDAETPGLSYPLPTNFAIGANITF